MSTIDEIMAQARRYRDSQLHTSKAHNAARDDLRDTIARTIGDLERARDAALEERNRLGVELAGARTRIAMSQEQAMHAMAEADDLRAEVERLRCRHWPETPADVRALLGSACAAVRYALPVPDGEFESEPHEDDTYTASAHDIITAIHRVTEHRMLCEVLTQEAEAARDAARTEAESLRAEVERLRAELARYRPDGWRQVARLTDAQMKDAARIAWDGLMDHIYEYGTASEGQDYYRRKFARAIESAVLAANGLEGGAA